MMGKSKPWWVKPTEATRRLLHIRFTKTVIVGALASLVDWVVLVCLVEFAHLTPDDANIPSLIAGASVQFLGNRHVVFKSSHKKAIPQMAKFMIGEVLSLGMNALGFHLLVTYTSIPYPFIRPVVTFLVFAGFSYPIWRKVFSDL